VRRITDENNLQPSAIERVRLHVKSSHRDVCDIAEPASGLQVKFSIRHLIAMTIAGVDTTKLESYSQATAQRPDLADLRARVEIVPDETLSRHSAWVEIETSDGQRHQSLGDVGRPMQDTQAQWNKLQGKFRRLMTPALGEVRVEEIIKMIGSFDELPDVCELLQRLRK